jgi:DNA (cytosine-5)-methyltransferase 1
MYALDFFCGAGGLTRGLLDAGISVLAGIDIDPECKGTYEFNNPRVKFVTADIRKIGLTDLKRLVRGKPFGEMLFAGGAPCQPFSPQRKGDDRPADATLLREFGRLVSLARPGQVLVENVPGIARVEGNSTFKRFLSILRKCGYRYTFDIVDAKQYGVPQTRRRLILMAMRRAQPSFPIVRFGCGPKKQPFRTVRQAIAHFPPIKAGNRHETVPNHVAACISAMNLERLKSTPRDGGDRRSWPGKLRLNCHKGDYKGHTDVYGRLAWDRPAPTLTGRCNSISNGRYGHPTQHRAISLREAAALQTFPDGYIFFGSNNHIALQIGNSVPVRLAEELGNCLLETKKRRKKK